MSGLDLSFLVNHTALERTCILCSIYIYKEKGRERRSGERNKKRKRRGRRIC